MTEVKVFDVGALYIALDRRRMARNLTWRQVGAEAGVTSSTLSRIGTGYGSPDIQNLCRLLLWLGNTDIAPYLMSGAIR